MLIFFFFSSRRRHTRCGRDWSSDVCSSDMVCYNDQITLMILEALRDEGIKVPEDFSLISFDDSSLAVASEVKLSSIKHPKAVMGRQAARFILDMIENKVSKPRQVYQPELTLRSSCRALV